jgi:hypothetical protein
MMSFGFHHAIVALCAACAALFGAEYLKPAALGVNSFFVSYPQRAACAEADWASCEPMLGP